MLESTVYCSNAGSKELLLETKFHIYREIKWSKYAGYFCLINVMASLIILIVNIQPFNSSSIR